MRSVPLSRDSVLTNTIDGRHLPGAGTLPDTSVSTPSGARSATRAAPRDDPRSTVSRTVATLRRGPTDCLDEVNIVTSNRGCRIATTVPSGLHGHLKLRPNSRILAIGNRDINGGPDRSTNVLRRIRRTNRTRVRMGHNSRIVAVHRRF